MTECAEYYQDGTCKHRDACDCWCHNEEEQDES